MNLLLLLDSTPLGRLTHPNSAQREPVRAWLDQQLVAGARVLVPAVCDYELRRELLRFRSTEGITRLDALRSSLGIAEVTQGVLDVAAELWAEARRRGRPATDNLAIDVDMILAATARTMSTERDVIVVSDNVRHLGLFCDARLWSEIN